MGSTVKTLPVKVSGLEGRDLDYWVCKAEGWGNERFKGNDYEVFLNARTTPTRTNENGEEVPDTWYYSPSSDWSQGGPLLQQAGISTMYMQESGEWRAFFLLREALQGKYYAGRSPLEAAMRLFVASKFGEEVQQPMIDGEEV